MGMLLLLLASSLAATHSLQRWQTRMQREQEQELIHIGLAYRDAIGRYYQQTPGIVKRYPPNLEALCLDTRFPQPRKHLRRLYRDPITQREGWGIVEAPSGGIMGIYSLSDKPPFKSQGYLGELQHLNDKKFYGEWYFVYQPTGM